MKNIRKIYRTDLIETHALDGVSVDVADGEFVAVMGRSGSGKTTFLNIAGLLDTFDEGTYHLDGQDVSRLSDSEMSRIRKVYRTQLVETYALDEITLEVDAGEFVAVMGRSGSGKTTFLNVAGLLDTFDAGGGTAYYDALAYAVSDTLRPLRGERTAIVILTDEDDCSASEPMAIERPSMR